MARFFNKSYKKQVLVCATLLAPSGRELARNAAEGECGIILPTKTLRYVGSFHRKRSPSLSEGGMDIAVLTPYYCGLLEF